MNVGKYWGHELWRNEGGTVSRGECKGPTGREAVQTTDWTLDLGFRLITRAFEDEYLRIQSHGSIVRGREYLCRSELDGGLLSSTIHQRNRHFTKNTVSKGWRIFFGRFNHWVNSNRQRCRLACSTDLDGCHWTATGNTGQRRRRRRWRAESASWHEKIRTRPCRNEGKTRD